MGNLTQLICPLCGRFVSLRYFDPSGFDDDIYAVEVHGLGRGRGVEVSERYSILQPGDETVKLIKDRILGLSRVLMESNCLKPAEVLSRLKIKPVTPWEFHKLKGDVKALTAELEDAERKRNRWRVEAETCHVKLENLKEQYDMRLKKREEELEDARRLNAGLKRELSRERREVETLEAELKDLKIELEEKEGELSGLYEEVGDMINSIEEALTADGEEWIWEADEEEEPMEALKERLRDLLNEYESLASEAEAE